MKLIAHRGLCDNYVCENTFKAIKNALNDKRVSGVEFDVRMTKDKKIVLIHDKTINRTSNGIGFVNSKNILELKKFNLGNKNYFQTIPTLEGILSLMNTRKIILIELKDYSDEFLDSIVKIINMHKNKKIYIMIFNEKLIDKLNFKNKGILRYAFFNKNKINNYKFYAFFYKFITKKLLKYLLFKRKRIFIWTVNKEKIIDIRKNLKYFSYKCFFISDEIF